MPSVEATMVSHSIFVISMALHMWLGVCPTRMKPIEWGWAGGPHPLIHPRPPQLQPGKGPLLAGRMGIGWLRCKNWSSRIGSQTYVRLKHTFRGRIFLVDKVCGSMCKKPSLILTQQSTTFFPTCGTSRWTRRWSAFGNEMARRLWLKIWLLK